MSISQTVLTEGKRCLTEAEAASYLSLSQSFLRQARMNGPRENRTPGPPFVRLGRAVRYLTRDLDAWLLRHRTEVNGGNDD